VGYGLVNAVDCFGDTIPSPCVFLNKLSKIRPNTTYRSSTIVFYYTLLHVSAVQISHQQVGVGYTKGNIKRERPVFGVVRNVAILF